MPESHQQKMLQNEALSASCAFQNSVVFVSPNKRTKEMSREHKGRYYQGDEVLSSLVIWSYRKIKQCCYIMTMSIPAILMIVELINTEIVWSVDDAQK